MTARTTRPLAALLVPEPVLDAVLAPADLERLAGAVELLRYPGVEALLQDPRAAAVEILVTGWGTPPVSSAHLPGLPALRLISHAAGTVRHLLPAAVWDAGVVVASAADVNAEPVADFCQAQIVLALKGLARGDVRRGPGEQAVRGLYGAAVGLVSFGAIASRLTARLQALDVHVSVWDPVVRPDVLTDAGVTPVAELGDLFAGSALVSVHTPLIAGVTERTVRREHLERLPAFATFLNTSRGAIVDEPDLAAVLTARPDLTAVLDVTVEEPPPPEHPLQHLPNVVLTGHSAGSVGSESLRLGAFAVDRVLEWVEHGRVGGALGRDEALRRA